MGRRSLLVAFVAFGLTIGGATIPSAPAQAGPSPVFADRVPAGANDWDCQPPAAHPNPIVLVHGFGANMYWNWNWLSPKLAARGYCVFALTHGRNPNAPPPFNEFGGVIPMEESAAQLSAFIDRILAATGAAKVDIVGHSEGSLMPNYYVKFLGGAPKVGAYVGLTPLWDGTNLLFAGTLSEMGRPSGMTARFESFYGAYCGSCPQFIQGSEFLAKMNEGGAAVPGITYTMVMTRYDELVVPYTSGILDAPNATNFVLQDQCPTDVSEHSAVAFDPVAAQDVFNALDPANASPIVCGALPPVTG